MGKEYEQIVHRKVNSNGNNHMKRGCTSLKIMALQHKDSNISHPSDGKYCVNYTTGKGVKNISEQFGTTS